jgi:hypothetical protein
MTTHSTESAGLLRHTLAALAYRAGKAVRGAPPDFASFRADPTSRTPAEILAHMGDLFDWALSLANGKQVWHDSAPLAWDQEIARFFASLEAFDRRVAEGPLEAPLERLFQGPIADALTHTGQIAMLRRMAGCAFKGENYYVADIAAGRVGVEQSSARKEF